MIYERHRTRMFQTLSFAALDMRKSRWPTRTHAPDYKHGEVDALLSENRTAIHSVRVRMWLAQKSEAWALAKYFFWKRFVAWYVLYWFFQVLLVNTAELKTRPMSVCPSSRTETYIISVVERFETLCLFASSCRRMLNMIDVGRLPAVTVLAGRLGFFQARSDGQSTT